MGRTFRPAVARMIVPRRRGRKNFLRFGFGDRTGLATPGHVESMRRAGAVGKIAPIFAQQSIREMTRTNRTPEGVMGDALRGAKEAGWSGKQGADADHLKTPADVDRTAA